jgi:hypothetical protein
LRTASIRFILLYIYSMSLEHQLIFFPQWHDQTVVELEARFHYLFDVVAGIASALLVMALRPVLIKSWNRATLRL